MKEKLRKQGGKPTEPGYYWYRTEHGFPQVVEVAPHQNKGELEAYFTGWECGEFVKDMEGQWPGRIPDCDWEGETKEKQDDE